MIHRYSLKGENFLLDVNSGSVHILDNVSYAVSAMIDKNMNETCPNEIFDNLQNFSKEDIKTAYDELYTLFKDGFLFADDDYIDFSKVILENAPVKALCLHVSHDCNLRCKYCFAETGDFGTGRKIMPIDVAKKAIDFVIERSGKRRNIEVDFFGGEPLMAMDTVRATVEYARSKEKEYNKLFRFTITTNGVLLNDDNIEYINSEMSNVVLSIDGSKETNDNMRKTLNGKSSYDIIMPKFQKLVENRDENLDYYARGTFTKENLNFAEDVLHIADCGFKHLSVEPVTSEANVGYDLSEDELPAIFEEYEKLCDILIERKNSGKEVNFFHFLVDLDQGPCVIKRLRGCGAGYEYVAVTPEGNIYPCHQFVGNEEYKQGNVFSEAFDMDISKKFSSLNIYSREKCTECWAKFYCSGGCSSANNLINGNLNEPYELGCILEKKRLECAIYMKSQV
ncbi:MAG: thioether cross-link-forming SCIFF peptide maturase [Clostridia bacterium]